MVGLKRYVQNVMSSAEDKERRIRRIRNHIKKDLRTPKYKQHVINPKKIEYKRQKYRNYEDNEVEFEVE